MKNIPSCYCLNSDVIHAKQMGLPVVALESAVITHGLPKPKNYELALGMEEAVRSEGAIPATIAIIGGKVCIGLKQQELENLAFGATNHKISIRDFGAAIHKKLNGGTTVAATLQAAITGAIKVFATGGIGGVHRNSAFDVSADLLKLAQSPVIVVCAGAKSILDLPATLEYLETVGVPVVGYKTEEFPAFYSIDSGLKVHVRVDSPTEVAEIAQAHWKSGLNSAVLVAVPPPIDAAIPFELVDAWIYMSIQKAQELGIQGNALTPFLLSQVSALSEGKSLKTNIALLLNNGHVAGQIAAAIHKQKII